MKLRVINLKPYEVLEVRVEESPQLRIMRSEDGEWLDVAMSSNKLGIRYDSEARFFIAKALQSVKQTSIGKSHD